MEKDTRAGASLQVSSAGGCGAEEGAARAQSDELLAKTGPSESLLLSFKGLFQSLWSFSGKWTQLFSHFPHLGLG